MVAVVQPLLLLQEVAAVEVVVSQKNQLMLKRKMILTRLVIILYRIN